MRADARERELKLGIRDGAIFEALLAAVGGECAAPVVQENHFFDSPERALAAQGLGLRLRREGGRWRLTLKGPGRDSADPLLADRAELECEIATELADEVLRMPDPLPRLLGALTASAPEAAASPLLGAARAAARGVRVAHLGGFRNVRTRVRTALAGDARLPPVTLEFDRTEFAPDDVHYEVELELTPALPEAPLREALLAHFRRLGAEPLPVSSKLARFLERRGRAASS